MKISFKVDSRYSEDLEDDFVMNENLTLYEFINNDPVKAFYLGYNISKWFNYLDKDQKYLYSKQIRHNKDDLEKYQKQIEYWSNLFPKDGEDVFLADLSEFIINNMIWDEETEDLDRVKLAFFFGKTISNNNTSNSILQIDPNGNIVKEWSSLEELVANFDCDKSAILKCLKGKQGFHRGFKWKYKDE